MFRYLRYFVIVVAAATVVGLVWMWPHGGIPKLNDRSNALPYVKGKVTGSIVKPCVDPNENLPTKCREYIVNLSNGSSGTFLVSNIDFSVPPIHTGDRVVLAFNADAPTDFIYTFVEFDRGSSMLVLVALFAIVVVGFGRWKGVRAMLGLAVSAAVVMLFLLPALLNGRNTTGAALVATSVVAFAALYLAHGVNRATTVALVGTLISVLLIAGLAITFTAFSHMTGLSDESFQILRVTAEALDPRGVLIAGIVLGALGVLDDVTVTQVSAVNELRAANPTMSRRDTYRAATRIGRDHVASTINTLVLAYAGASLALLLFFFQEGRAVTQILNREVVAVEIARALVGSIGLIIAVPITTALAVGVLSDHGLAEV